MASHYLHGRPDVLVTDCATGEQMRMWLKHLNLQQFECMKNMFESDFSGWICFSFDMITMPSRILRL